MQVFPADDGDVAAFDADGRAASLRMCWGYGREICRGCAGGRGGAVVPGIRAEEGL